MSCPSRIDKRVAYPLVTTMTLKRVPFLRVFVSMRKSLEFVYISGFFSGDAIESECATQGGKRLLTIAHDSATEEVSNGRQRPHSAYSFEHSAYSFEHSAYSFEHSAEARGLEAEAARQQYRGLKGRFEETTRQRNVGGLEADAAIDRDNAP